MSEPFGTDRRDYIDRRGDELQRILRDVAPEDIYDNTDSPTAGAHRVAERNAMIMDGMEAVAGTEFDDKQYVEDDDLIAAIHDAIQQDLDIRKGKIANVVSITRPTAPATPPEEPPQTIPLVSFTLSASKEGGLLTQRAKDILSGLDAPTVQRMRTKIVKKAREAAPVEDEDIPILVRSIMRASAEKVARKEDTDNNGEHFEGVRLVRELDIELDTIQFGPQIPPLEIQPDEIKFGQPNRFTDIAMHTLQDLGDEGRAELTALAKNKVRFMNDIPKEMRTEEFITLTAGLLVQQAAEMVAKDNISVIMLSKEDFKTAVQKKIETERFDVLQNGKDR